VSRELWHPKQKLITQKDGSLLMELPFIDLRELSMDVLRQGRHVEVLEPPELREQVAAELRTTLKQYR
jgi:predicted DNA-binding transcriptional regulator YafY